ncbi:MAG: hypothetical protein HPY69_09530 [Armatimonadetes bacterium]|nr:hypothetical protein [Armatimonadota bacterium]
MQVPARRSVWQAQWPLLAVLALLAGAIGFLYVPTSRATAGGNVYVNDDSYIHMALARNLAEHGVWGITRYEFSGSSSSPLWTLLLAACYRVFGPGLLIPLVLNVLLALAVAVAVHHWLLREDLEPPGLRFVATSAVVFLAPVPLLVFCGMEHTLHVLLTLLLSCGAATTLSRPDGDTGARLWLPVLAALSVMARLESLFLVAVLVLLCLVRRRWDLGALLGLGAALPVAVYAAISLAHGWMWLPNSVLVKGHGPRTDLLHYVVQLLGTGYGQTMSNPFVYALLLAGLVVLAIRLQRPNALWTVPSLVLVLFLGGLVLHVQLAVIARSFLSRYEGYLVALGILGLALSLRDRPAREPGAPGPGFVAQVVLIVTLLAFAAPVVVRAVRPYRQVPILARNTYEQQVQMGRFLAAYWPGATVVANDIGAINYLADIHCLDIGGLGTLETGQWIIRREFNPGRLEALARERQADIAVCFDSWLRAYAGGIPPGWRKIGGWTIQDNIVCADPTVSFYAIAPGTDVRLMETLRDFSPRLPASVVQTGAYVGARPAHN